MATSPKRYPITPQQAEQLQQDIAIADEKLQSIAVLMRASHGDTDRRTIRAEETAGAFERFKRELERAETDDASGA